MSIIYSRGIMLVLYISELVFSFYLANNQLWFFLMKWWPSFDKHFCIGNFELDA